MSVERRKMLRFLGAEIELTPREQGMKGAVAKASALLAGDAGRGHARISSTTRPIRRSTGARPPRRSGTTPTARWTSSSPASAPAARITGVGQVLKPRKPDPKMIAVEPEASPVLSGGAPGPHPLQGLGAGFVPEILDTRLIDEVVQVSNADILRAARRLAAPKASRAASRRAPRSPLRSRSRKARIQGKLIVTIIPSFAERYISTALFEGL